MQLQKQAEEKERRGRHFLDDNKGNRQDGKKRPRKSKSPSPETDELKQLKKMKMIQDLVVKVSNCICKALTFFQHNF